MLSSTKNIPLESSLTTNCPMVENEESVYSPHMDKDDAVSASNCVKIDSEYSFEIKQGLDYGLASPNPFELLKHLNQNDYNCHGDNSIDGHSEMCAISSACDLTSFDSDYESPHISSLSKKNISEAVPNKLLNKNSKKKSKKND